MSSCLQRLKVSLVTLKPLKFLFPMWLCCWQVWCGSCR